METKTSFIIFEEWIESIAQLDNDTRLRLYDAIFGYAFAGILPNLSPLEMAVFNLVKSQIDRSNEKYEDVKKKRSEAGKKSAEVRRKPEPEQSEERFVQVCSTNPNKREQTGTNLNKREQENVLLSCVEHNDNVNVNVNVIKENDDDDIGKEIALLKSQEIWLDSLQTLHNIDKNHLIRYLDQFALHCRAEGKTKHDKPGDAQSHFNGWLRIQLDQNGRQQNNRRGRNNLSPGEIKNYKSTF